VNLDMKRLISLIFLLTLFCIFNVVAGDVLKLDFTKQDQYISGLKEGDMTEFYLNGERNIIIVDKIKPDSVDVTAFIAQETNGYPYYTTLSKTKTLKLDVERDDIDDLFVTFYRSSENLEYVYLLMKKPEIIPTGGVVVNEIKREKRGYDKYMITGFILSIVLLVFLIFKYKKSK